MHEFASFSSVILHLLCEFANIVKNEPAVGIAPKLLKTHGFGATKCALLPHGCQFSMLLGQQIKSAPVKVRENHVFRYTSPVHFLAGTD